MRIQLSKTNQTLFFFVLLTIVLYYSKSILISFFFAILLAMLMAPLCQKLDSKGLRRAVSCIICVFILLLVFLGMMAIMIGQISEFINDISLLEQKTNELLISLHGYVEKQFGIPVADQALFIKNETQNMGQFLKNFLTDILRSSIHLIAGMTITLVFTFLFLFHKEKYFSFFLKFIPGDSHIQKVDVLHRIGKVSQHYLVGRAISIITLFILYAIALMIIGIKNALLLAAVAGLFNIIPYLGPILAAVFPFLVALLTEESYQPAIWVIVSFCLFQALDNYWITPYFLGGEVSLSALSTIVIMICGGLVWGIAGMILFIPMLSIAKIIFDHIPGLEDYGHLIGDNGIRPTVNMASWLRKLFSKK